MNTLDYAIILEYQRCKMFNECEELDETQKELLNDITSRAYSQVSEADYNNILSENETFYTDVKNYVMGVLNKYNLEFYDKRCYGYLIDGVHDMLL